MNPANNQPNAPPPPPAAPNAGQGGNAGGQNAGQVAAAAAAAQQGMAPYVPNGGAALSLAQAAVLRTAIAQGLHVVPAARAAHAAHADTQPQQMALTIPDGVKEHAINARQEMLGVCATDVLAAFYSMVTLARYSNNYTPLIADCLLAVNMAPTVARNRVNQYAALAPTSMFRQFEIQGRAADLTSPEGVHGNWVVGSPMHAGSVRLMGLMLVAVAPAGGIMAKVRDRMGSILALPPAPAAGTTEPERTQLLRQAALGLSLAEVAHINGLMPRFAKLLTIIDLIYGEAGGNLDNAIAAADLYQGYEI